jgi:hypothetical protein
MPERPAKNSAQSKPEGVDPMRCQKVYYTTKLNFPRPKRCPNNAIVERDGVHYCGIHDPERLKKSAVSREEKRQKKLAEKMALHRAYLYAKQRKLKS